MAKSSAVFQTATSRHRSLKMSIANQIWDTGTNAFFQNKIPFSIRNGAVFAERLCKLYERHILDLEAKGKARESYHVMEMGAGIGFLSRFFMDQLMALNPDLYMKTVLHVTEWSHACIQKMKEVTLHRAHSSRVKYHVMDARYPKSPDSQAPIFVFSTYLIDSLPQNHFEIVDGQVREIMVQSAYNGAMIVDQSQIPSSEVSFEECKEVLIENPSGKRDILAPQLIDAIKETFGSLPYSKSPDYDEGVDQLLRNFAKNTSVEREVRLNFHRSVMDHLQNTWDMLDDDGVYLLSDFGYSDMLQKTPADLLLSTYGVSAFYQVPFPLIRYIISDWGGHSLITRQEQDQTQECLISKSEASPIMKEGFSVWFKDLGYERIIAAIDDLSSLMDTEDYLEKMSGILSTLNPLEMTDYYLLTVIITQLIDDSHPEEAEKYVDILYNTYGNMAADVHRFRGCLLQNKDEHDLAVKQFLLSLRIFPNDAMSHAAIGLSYLCQHQFKLAAESMSVAYRYALGDDRWQQAFGAGIAYRHAGERMKSDAIFKGLMELEAQHPGLLPEGYRQRIMAQINTLST